MAVAQHLIWQYVSNASTLLHAIEQNAADGIAVRDHNERIRYYYDTNIIIWYSKPNGNLDYVSLLPDDIWGDDKKGAGHAFVTAILTLEYLFSPLLVGRGGYAPRLTLEHGHELSTRVQEDFDKARSTRHPQNSGSYATSVPGDLRAQIENFKTNSSDERLAEIYWAFQKFIAAPLTSDMYSVLRLGDLYKNSKIERGDADSDSENGQEEVDKDLVDKWTMRLQRASRGTTEGRSINVDADARSLARLQTLNDEAELRNPRLSYVLVTGDESIHQAVETWVRDTKRTGIRRWLFVRHPRQFVPILNLNSFPGSRNHKLPVFEQLAESIRDLVVSYQDIVDRTGSRQVDDSHFAKHVFEEIKTSLSQDDWKGLEDRIEHLKLTWLSAIRTASLLNIELLENASETMKQVVNLLSDSTIGEALERKIQQQVSDIERDHFILLLRGRFQQMFRARSSTRASRAPLLFYWSMPRAIQRRISDLTDEEFNFNQTLDWIGFNGDQSGLKALEEAIVDLPAAQGSFMAAAVSLRARAWKSARHFSERAERSLAGPTEDDKNAQENIRDEAAYCRWLASRFIQTNLSELQQLRLEIVRCIADYKRRRDRFRQARASAELGASLLFYVFAEVTRPDSILRNPDFYLRSMVIDSMAYLEHARAIVDVDQRDRTKASAVPWSRLDLQIATNLCAAHLARLAFFGDSYNSLNVLLAEKDLQRMSKLADMQGLRTEVVQTNFLVLQALLSKQSPSERSNELKAHAIAFLDSAILRQSDDHAVDKSEARWLRTYLLRPN